MPENNAVSPLEELRGWADHVWNKVAPGKPLTDDEIAEITDADRAARDAWINKTAGKKPAKVKK